MSLNTVLANSIARNNFIQSSSPSAPSNSPNDNPNDNEDRVTDALVSGLAHISDELAKIKSFSFGGAELFNYSLEVMYTNRSAKDQSIAINKENLYQVGLLDVMSHLAEYGLDNDDKFKTALGLAIEYTGSGQHNNWLSVIEGKEMHTVDVMKIVAAKLADKIKAGSIPIDSIAGKCFSGGLDTNIYEDSNYYSDNDYYWIKQSSTDISPMIRLELLSRISRGGNSLSQEEAFTIISTGDKAALDAISQKYLKVDAYDAIFLNKNPGDLGANWQDSHNEGSSAIHAAPVAQYYFDYAGQLGNDYLQDLYKGFPSRSLTSDEVSKVNRFGDNAKIIYELLKYKLNTLRDTRMQIAQNI